LDGQHSLRLSRQAEHGIVRRRIAELRILDDRRKLPADGLIGVEELILLMGEISPPIKEKTNMNTRIAIPVTARRFRKKRLATSIPGDSTFTRRSSFRE
jgi:hypothetical protein